MLWVLAQSPNSWVNLGMIFHILLKVGLSVSFLQGQSRVIPLEFKQKNSSPWSSFSYAVHAFSPHRDWAVLRLGIESWAMAQRKGISWAVRWQDIYFQLSKTWLNTPTCSPKKPVWSSLGCIWKPVLKSFSLPLNRYMRCYHGSRK